MRIVGLIMALLFAGCAAVQYNDPDAVLWIGVYGGTALITLVHLMGRLRAGVAVAWCGFSLAGALYFAARVLGIQPLVLEEGREMLGLFIVALWTGALVFFLTRKRHADPGNATL